MRFRPCIDIHNGKVKQIVGGSLKDGAKEGNEHSTASENFVSEYGADHFAELYKDNGLFGGHVILLNKAGTPEYEATKAEALSALRAYKSGLSAGGGITAENAAEFLDAGAYAVIVTSYVFRDGIIDFDRLEALRRAIGREHIILDLSCRRRDDAYYIVTDRWQKFTDTVLDQTLLKKLEEYSCEYLIHAVDVEGRQSGIDEDVVKILAQYKLDKNYSESIPVTYAGGVHSYNDIELLKGIGKGLVDVTIGSSLDIFGGNMSFKKVLEKIAE
ncbi:MAG: phosphoribosylformimino-5-aminoimidazole carboxamide ribotide isomerase [Lachnospiraceae bacterium]|nr:phosphoribosylformimino-5-aminoimidazole carboxamide ribotide isomerase [Lachnospiraceae bacterium]